jgi:membrane protein implicated in regulation of membrane protease activity
MEILVELLGSWSWVVFGLVLLGLEILLPSTFLLWPGLAALVVGTITLVLGMNSPIWPWQLKLIVFLALSLIIAFAGRKIMANRDWEHSENETLNDRNAQLVGQTAVVVDPIVNGRGRAKLGDTTWRVQGADAKAGTSVMITGSDAGALLVEPVK